MVVLSAACGGAGAAPASTPSIPSTPSMPSTSAAPAAPAAAAQEAWRDLFAQPDPPAAAQQIEAVLAACGNNVAAMKKLIAADDAFDAVPAGWSSHTVPVADGATKYDVSFVVYVPRTYRRDKPHPLILTAHGQGENGLSSARVLLEMLGRSADQYLVVGPTMPGPPIYNGKAYQEQAYLQPLAWAKRHLNVDDDRVHVNGYSQGGHGTWHLATMFPRLFASGVAMAGTPWFEGAPHTSTLYLENLSNLALWAIWGDQDKPKPPAIGQVQFCRAASDRLAELNNTRFGGTEVPGAGHGGCWPRSDAFTAFLAANKRQPVPDKFEHVFHLDTHRRGYYLEARELAAKPMKMDGAIRIPFQPRADDPQGDKAGREYFAKALFKMSAELDRPGNALTVRVTRIRTVRVFVTEGMFDLSKPVTLRLGSRTWKGTIAPSARCLLDHYADDRDGSALVYNEIDLDVTGRVTARYK
jgi:predicted esterase